ncbi:transcription/translation regulatory transformer protein RfaH [Pseudoalteromonas sp. NEC-BIFX-2020_002]|uniref:Transcriptional regulator n=1 Tax=Pseudoalteromonas porphyrae TaxID=187330 RepID=A0A0N1EPN7_9GAMM|nr:MULTISPECIES: transcription/translation regulatory transformer protein RfaH [Pseudoalteromonas]KPH65155.1 transcriptional regulator [Pseudoalteromonas porphyrae]NNG45135.1 transcription/translation regulatory transformer protein RfaH [Pseudoalteromonas sp. NEC-BIFX-2020_002]
MDSWYLLFCKPRQEARAQVNLQNQGMEAFFPLLKTEKLVKGRRTFKESALFPNYLFVRLNSQQCNFSAVKNTRGISGFVSYGSSYQIVPDLLISELQKFQPNIDSQNLPSSGDLVYLSNGSFNGVQAIYQEPDGDMRSILLVNLLNQKIKMSVDNRDIKKAG